MSRAAARFTQADVTRAIRAARKEGADSVEIAMPTCSIKISLSPQSPAEMALAPVEPEREVIL